MKKTKIITLAFSLCLLCFLNIQVWALSMPSFNLVSIFTYNSETSFDEIICNLQYNSFNYGETYLDSNLALDATLELEEWMFKAEWSAQHEFINEADLELEQWMLEGDWNSPRENFTESELQLESWMLSPARWDAQYN